MVKKNLKFQIYLSYLLLTLASLLAIGWYTLDSFREIYFEKSRADLSSRAQLVLQQVSEGWPSEFHEATQKQVETFGRVSATRVTLILPSGRVVGDSEEHPSRMDNHANRPEIQEAMEGRTGSSVRFSHTLNYHLMYVAIPAIQGGQVVGVVRTSLPLMQIEEALAGIQNKIALAGLVIILFVTPISVWMSRRISHPLFIMKKSAERFARGELESRIQVEGSEDVISLARALNQMAAQLDERIRTITTHRNEQQAILSSIVEGLIAVDSEERIISLNEAAAQFLDVSIGHATGRSIQEVMRHTPLQKFVRKALTVLETVEEDIVLDTLEGEHYLQAVGTALRDAQDKRIGAVIVLNDVTRLKKLETVRRDFVANVSHELRTPITSIKGFVETLLNGAMESREDTERFLNIMAKQADRLNAIIEDLLALSRIEQESEKYQIVLEKTGLKSVLETAILDCHSKASEKKIRIDLQCDPKLKVSINPPLIEQAVVNLIDNAIKYSSENTSVRVRAEESDHQVILSVLDEGRGIGEEHLPRLFERFYRVDKARSRQLGGTGLGLSIVKHIAQAHGGRVGVESTVGRGSIFRIHIPFTSDS